MQIVICFLLWYKYFSIPWRKVLCLFPDSRGSGINAQNFYIALGSNEGYWRPRVASHASLGQLYSLGT